jgi:hypothetical protein
VASSPAVKRQWRETNYLSLFGVEVKIAYNFTSNFIRALLESSIGTTLLRQN